MFQNLARYERIAVTGPQRSGTTFAAHAIATDTGHRYVDELEFGAFDVGAWLRLLFSGEPVVVQCPHMLRYLVDLQSPEIFVVLMRRNLADIHRSAARIGWNDMEEGAHRELTVLGVDNGDPATLKYEYWDGHPKPPHYLEVDYTSLEQHPDYLSATQRQDFEVKQTTVVRVRSNEATSRPSRRRWLARLRPDPGTEARIE